MISSNSRIVVTGGAGFIGSNVVLGLNERGITDLTIVDRVPLDDPRRAYLKDLRYKNLIKPEEFFDHIHKREIQEPDVIIHLGARADTSERRESFFARDNTFYTKALFDYCVEKGKRIIYASSTATYGDGSRGFSEEERNLKPLNPYGMSKYKADELILESAHKPPQWVGMKFVNVYGPRESYKGRMATMVYHGYKQVLETGGIKLFKSYREEYKDGEQKRDLVYVKDVVKVILFFLENPAVSGIFNVGTGEPRTFLDIARILFYVLGKEPKIEFIDIPEDIRDAYQYFTQADISKLRAAGYREKFYTLEEGIRDYIEHCLRREQSG